ncbi:MAG TPA: fibronectin type III domain-containing protein [Actinophytocola sp.]|uniref:fibronectin type III domain-containing protein n=1 Tax=Actinophytocola sp. TaxID=1872138 RepID=UPI002DB88DE9|nr:fibronectin type III domain-containing protein [Actinophytocola sp.]HEU5471410.1 fibronectin type III domain-containing protein [Actinophytocola sp.]
MSHRKISRRLVAGLTAAGTAGAVVAGLLVSAGNSSAEPRELTLRFNCSFPLIGNQDVTVTISADIPATIPVNTPSDPFAINAVANAGVNATAGLVLVGATTIEGFSDAGSRITAPGIDLPLTVPAQIPVQPVPAQGQPLILNATGTSPSVTFPQAGTARISVETLALRALHPRNAQGGDTGLGVFDAPCTTVAGQNTTLAEITVTDGGGGGDTEAPTAPGQPVVEATTTDSVSLSWPASTDNVGVTAYDVFNGDTLATTVTGTSATVTGLTAATSYTFTVKARDEAGNVSAASPSVTAQTQPGQPPVDTTPPTAPGNLTSTGATQNSVSLSWSAATDNVGVTGYDVFNGSTLATSVTGTSATVSGLTADTSYTFTVQARDAAGNTSPASNAVTVRTQAGGGGGDLPVNFALTGSSTIRAANGTIQVSGSVAALLNLATGNFSADLQLNPTTGRFTVLGFLPATAKIQFVQAERTTGTFAAGVLSATARTTIKLPQVKIFGFPIAGGPTCQTRTPAEIPLRSGPNFDPIAGGSVSGTYTIPALQGCGVLNDLVSMLTTGPGNTIQATLAPPAASRARR